MLDLALTHRSWAFENTRSSTGPSTSSAESAGSSSKPVKPANNPANRHTGTSTPASNERLELLGDAVLSMCVLEHIYRKYPKLSEGTMSDVRSQAVRGSKLAAVAERYGVGSLLKLGRGEDRGGGRNNPRLLGDALEAIIAAVYLDAGVRAASAMVVRMLGQFIDDAVTNDTASNHTKPSNKNYDKSTHDH